MGAVYYEALSSGHNMALMNVRALVWGLRVVRYCLLLMIPLQLWFLHKTCEGQSAPQQTELTALSGFAKRKREGEPMKEETGGVRVDMIKIHCSHV